MLRQGLTRYIFRKQHLLRGCHSVSNFDALQKGLVASIHSSDLHFSGSVLGGQAEGSSICRHGGTVVHAALATARIDDPQSEDLQLQVDYRARSYAFGIVPDNKNKRWWICELKIKKDQETH